MKATHKSQKTTAANAAVQHSRALIKSGAAQPSFVRLPTAEEIEKRIRPQMEELVKAILPTIEKEITGIVGTFVDPDMQVQLADLHTSKINMQLAFTSAFATQDLVVRSVSQIDFNIKLAEMIDSTMEARYDPEEWVEKIEKLIQFVLKEYRTWWQKAMVFTWDLCTDTQMSSLIPLKSARDNVSDTTIGSPHPLKPVRWLVRGFARELGLKFKTVIEAPIFRDSFSALENLLLLLESFKVHFPQIKEKIQASRNMIVPSAKGSITIAGTGERLEQARQDWKAALVRLAQVKLAVARQKFIAPAHASNAQKEGGAKAADGQATTDGAFAERVAGCNVKNLVTEVDLQLAEECVALQYEIMLQAINAHDAANDAALAKTGLAGTNRLALRAPYEMLKRIRRVVFQLMGLIAESSMVCTHAAYAAVFEAADMQELKNMERFVEYLEKNDPTIMKQITEEFSVDENSGEPKKVHDGKKPVDAHSDAKSSAVVRSGESLKP